LVIKVTEIIDILVHFIIEVPWVIRGKFIIIVLNTALERVGSKVINIKIRGIMTNLSLSVAGEVGIRVVLREIRNIFKLILLIYGSFFFIF